MRKAFKIGALLLLVILVVTAFAMPASAKQVFTDLSPEHWCYSKIMDFEEKGYVCGYSDNTFRADKIITRAEYVKIVNNFFGYKQSEKTTSKFKDVNSGDWFMPYVNEAVDRGYIEGFEDGTFRPQDPIRRQEATVILARILKIDKEVYPENHKDGLAQYSDSDEVQEWARVAIHSYSVYNFINGYEDGTLRILKNVTRAETVELLHILEQKVIIDRRPGGGTTNITLKPDIDVININLFEANINGAINVNLMERNIDREITLNEYKPAVFTNSGWINEKNSSEDKETRRNGAFVNITSQTVGSTIHDTVDVISRKEEYTTTKRDEYDNKFFLADGVYAVTAKATKAGRRDSSIVERKVKIDTVAPIAYGVASTESGEIAHKQSITVSVKDPNPYKANEISGLDKVAYAWFNADTEKRVTSWIALSLADGQAKVDAPVVYGRYKLGIAASDIAENTFGVRTEFSVKSGDISGDIPTNPSGDVNYDFVKETESGDKTPSGDDIVVIVGNNVPTIQDLVMYTRVNELVSGELVGKDVDSADELRYCLQDAPTYGTATVKGNKTTFVSDKAGTYNYTVKVKDDHGGEATGNVTVYVFDLKVDIPQNPSGNEIKYPDLSSDKLIIFVDEEKNITANVVPSGDPIKVVEYDWNIDGANGPKAEITSGEDKEEVTVKGLIPGETKITVEVEVNIEKPDGEVEVVELEEEITVVVLSRITIQIPSDSKTYDGTALKAGNFEVVSGDAALEDGIMASEDKVAVKVSGERIDVGSGEATLESYTIVNNLGEDVAKYYVPTFKNGVLTVIAKENEIIITAGSATKKYDGTVLKNSEYTYTSGVLVFGDTLEAVVSGEQLNVGISDNKVISYKVTRNGMDVTSNYTFGEVKDGKLEIAKRNVTLTSATASKEYDGKPLTSGDVTVTGDGFVAGEGVTYNVTGSQLEEGSSKNNFAYTLNEGTLADNYNITKVEGTLEVTPVTAEVVVKVKGNSASGDKYNGREKNVRGYQIVSISNKLYTSDNVTYSGETIARGTNAGIHKMGLKVENFRNNSKNFTNVKFVLVEDGKLEIAKRNVTLTSATASKEYDGKPLTSGDVTVTGDGFVAGEGVTYNVTGSQLEEGSSKNNFAYTLNEGTLADNYNITKVEGTLEVKAKKVTYVVEYYKENLSGDYESADEETKNITLGNGTTKAEYNKNKYTDGFEFESVNPTDLTIPASGELVVKVYFARKSYTLTVKAGENVKSVTDGNLTSGEIVLTVKYGAKVNIDANLEEIEGHSVKFDKWQASSGKDIKTKEATITMPANDLTLTATAKKEEKLPSVNISLKSDYPKNEKEAEPSDTIGYETEIKNNESYEIRVKINIDSADEINAITVYDKDGNELETLTSLDETITIPAGATVKITYKSEVPSTYPINKDFTSTVKVSTQEGKKISSKSVSNDIEKSVGVLDKTNKDKNVILILDLSGSMNDDTKDGKKTKIAALRIATQQFVNKLYNNSKETNTKITLNVIGIGEASTILFTYSSPSKKENDFPYRPVLVDTRYSNNDAYLIDSYINTNASSWITSSFISNSLQAYGGTNIVGALKLANGIMDRTYTSKDGITNFIASGDNYVVMLTDGANGSNANEPISGDSDGLSYAETLRNSGAGIYAIYFEGADSNINTKGKADLNTILNGEFPLYEAGSEDSLNMAFDSIASSISKNQSKKGKITAALPADGKYFPIKVTYKEKGTEKELFRVENLAGLETYKMTVEGNKLAWDLSGSTYSEYEDLKLKLTLDNTATDGKALEDELSLFSNVSGEKAVFLPAIDETETGKQDVSEEIVSGAQEVTEENTSGDQDIKKQAAMIVFGDGKEENDDKIKSSEIVSGENKTLADKDLEIDSKEDIKKQDDDIDVKEEKKVDNENKVDEELKEAVDPNKEKQEVESNEENKGEETEQKLEEKNINEVIIEEKKEPIIIEEKKNDDDSNDTTDKEIE